MKIEPCASAWEELLKRLDEATTEEQKSQALMWIIFLPQALLRKPTGRKGREGRGQVRKRFRCLQHRDWGALVELQQKDLLKLTSWHESGPTSKKESEDEKQPD